MSTGTRGLVGVALLLLALPCLAETFVGRVVGVVDGDTLTIRSMDDGIQYRVRLIGIDAPERKQPFGNVSKRHLSETAYGAFVKVEYDKLDRYGRVLAYVSNGKQDVGLEQIKAGMAWHFKRYGRDQRKAEFDRYASAESQARAAKRGLWSQKTPAPPWAYRKHRKSQ